MKAIPRRFRSGLLQSACWILILSAGFSIATSARADGCFVMPKFVWDKHRDINEPTQKAIIAYDAGHEDIILQVKYGGPVEEFGWLIPVPNVPTVSEGSMECFYELSKYTQNNFERRFTAAKMSLSNSRGQSIEPKPPVKVIETKTVGAYQVAVLSAQDAGALENWLTANHFFIPPDTRGMIDSYVKQGWYFVAARINLSKAAGFALIAGPPKAQASAEASLEEKMSSGELRPLHLAFASGKCIFPLKISSVNGKPSEVQVYVLSPEPLLERTMFERKLPALYTNDVARARESAVAFVRSKLFTMMLAYGNTNSPLSAEDEATAQKIRETPRISGELPKFAKVTKKELSQCSKEIPRLTENSWWLHKETWNFKPEEMRDLEFEPAASFLANQLDSRYGYYAAACLAQLGSAGVGPLLEGLQSSNAVIRSAIISTFDLGYAGKVGSDPAFRKTALEWIKSPDPELRRFAVEYVGLAPEDLLFAMHDEDSKVAGIAGESMMEVLTLRPEGKKYLPAIQEMLKDKNPAAREAAVLALRGVHVTIPRADLLQFFKVPNLFVIATACTKLKQEGEDISNEDVIPLLQNTDPSVRAFGLKTLYHDVQKSSIELALPLLKDPEQIVRRRACDFLADLTGQDFSADEPAQWEKWWVENKANFVVNPEQVVQRRTNRQRQRTDAAFSKIRD
jgi:hypothetical protein